MKKTYLLLILSLAVTLYIVSCGRDEPAEPRDQNQPAAQGQNHDHDNEHNSPEQDQANGAKETENSETGNLEIGEEVPEFTLENYDGNEVSLSDYEDSIVVLEWFNYDCPFTQYHYKDKTTMKDLAEKYKDRNVQWLAINTTHYATKEANREFAEKHDVPFPILDDSSGKVGMKYHAKRTPHMYIIDANGVLVYEGAIDNAPPKTEVDEEVNYVNRALNELTSGMKITQNQTEPYGCTVKYKPER